MHIYNIDDLQSQAKLVELSDPAAAELIRALHLRPYTDRAPRPHISKNRSWVNLSRPSSSSGSSGKSKATSRKSREGRQLLGNLRGLKNLEHLDIECHLKDDLDAFKQTLPSLKLSWSGYSTSLRSLSLRIPLEFYHCLLPSSLFLPRLSKLTIYIYASHHSTNPVEPMCAALVPFINRHVSTLESLSVITPSTGTADLSPMFFNLRFFPRLTTIHLTFCALSLEYINLKGIQEFFSSHSHQLQDVKLHFDRMVGLKTEDFKADIFFALPMFLVPLFSLHTLDLGFQGFRDPDGLGTLSYAHRFGNSLRHLHTTVQLSTATLSRLVTPLTALRVLEVAVPYLTPGVLDVLSTQSPQINELRLSFMAYSGSEGSYVSADDLSRMHKFCAEMSCRLYPGWSLRHLKTRKITSPPTSPARMTTPPLQFTPTDATAVLANNADLDTSICLRALVTALPTIQTIDGVRRSNLLNQERSSTRHWNLSVYDS